MAIKLKFTCNSDPDDFITVEHSGIESISIEGMCGMESFELLLDVPTSIKFYKVLRNEINKAKGVNNE